MLEPDSSVTIAVPVHNGERFVAQALASAIDQTVTPHEILVFDNCSTDDTLTIARRFVPASGLRPSGRNLGAAANFNRAVRESTGDYFAWLAADDRLAPEFVELTTDALARNPQAAACLTGIRFVDEAGSSCGVQHDLPLASTEAGVRLSAFLRRGRWTEVYCMYRRLSLLESPLFQPKYGADVLLTWWFLLRGPLVVLDEELLEYRLAAPRTREEMAAALALPDVGRHWRMGRLWLDLWAETGADGVDRSTRRIARRALVTCLGHRAWQLHLAHDVRLRLYAATTGLPGVHRLLFRAESRLRARRERRLLEQG